MRENHDIVLPAIILTVLGVPCFFWATQHTTVCLDLSEIVHGILNVGRFPPTIHCMNS